MSEDDVTDVADPIAASEPSPEVYGCPLTDSLGQQVLHVPRERLREVVKALTADGFLQCIDSFGVDYLGYNSERGIPTSVKPERFEVVVSMICHRDGARYRLRVQVPADDPTCPSLFELHPGTEAMERETFDMYGIVFDDHPDMTRVLMPEEWEGHPLRKDYSLGNIPVQFKGAHGR